MLDAGKAASSAPPGGAGSRAANDSHALIRELLHEQQALRARVHELAATNDQLRREAARAARRLQTILCELAVAAERLGDQPMCRVIRAVAARPGGADIQAILSARSGVEHQGPRAFDDGVPGAPRQSLSAREREVLRLLSEGSRSSCIATDLGISIATVEVHRRNIMRKLGLHGVAALTKYAVREGLTPF